jgi:hypothetical protein
MEGISGRSYAVEKSAWNAKALGTRKRLEHESAWNTKTAKERENREKESMKRRRLLLVVLSPLFLCVLCYGVVVLGNWIATSSTLDLPAPTWKVITPGQTTSDAVIQILGQPQQVWCKDHFYGYLIGPIDDWDGITYLLSGFWPCRPDESVYFYQNPLDDRDLTKVTVILRSGKVWALRVKEAYPFSSTNQTVAAVFSQFIQEHGKPERVGWSKIGYMCDHAVIYPKLGILMHVTNTPGGNGWIRDVTYFRPMSLEEAEIVFNEEANFRGPQTFQRGDIKCSSMDPWRFNQ